jgi:hypothetical protein
MCILEMTGDLSDLFTAPARDAKVEAANRPEPVLVVVGRSRRRRRRRKDETSSDESDNEAEAGENVAGEVRAVDPTDTVSQMKGELDEHVRALRKGVEGLAEEGERGSGSGEQRGTWGMLALALEDWR